MSTPFVWFDHRSEDPTGSVKFYESLLGWKRAAQSPPGLTALGDRHTDLVGMRFVYGFTPRAFFNAFVQYNADRNELSSNIRFHLIHHPLSDLFIVYNDRRDTERGDLVDRALIVKFTNLFNF